MHSGFYKNGNFDSCLMQKGRSMESVIRHEGVVSGIPEGSVQVRIVQSSACSGCKASSICHVSSEQKERIIEVQGDRTPGLQVGDRVVIAGSESQGMRAVILAFGIPVLLLVAVVIACLALHLPDSVAALLCLAAMVIYFGGLALFRTRLKGQFSFEIIEVIK